MNFKSYLNFISTFRFRSQLFLWYYRVLHSTFGGLVIESNGQLGINKYLKYYGVIFGLLKGAADLYTVYLFKNTPFMKQLYKSGFVITYYLSLSLKICEEIRCIFIFWFLQMKGIEFFRVFFIYRIEKSRNLIKLFFVWLLHIIVPLTVGGYQLYRITIRYKQGGIPLSFSKIFFILIQTFLTFSISWSIGFLMWSISAVIFEILKQIESNLLKIVEKQSVKIFPHNIGTPMMAGNRENNKTMLAFNRKLFFEIRSKLLILDKLLTYVMLVDVSVAICIIMVQIYALVQNNPFLKQFATIVAFGTLSEIIKLVINCLANGLVYDKSDRIMNILDNIVVNDLDDNQYRELIAFKTMSREVKFGFTIGGFAPLRKTTLLAIFSFMMNYTVILVQTANRV